MLAPLAVLTLLTVLTELTLIVNIAKGGFWLKIELLTDRANTGGDQTVGRMFAHQRCWVVKPFLELNEGCPLLAATRPEWYAVQ